MYKVLRAESESGVYSPQSISRGFTVCFSLKAGIHRCSSKEFSNETLDQFLTACYLLYIGQKADAPSGSAFADSEVKLTLDV
jgi:hypothetical protein